MNVCVFCALGMSTSIVVRQISIAAERKGIDLNIEAYSVSDIDELVPTCDLVLLGPQVQQHLKKLKRKYPDKLILVMPIKDYGMANGENILNLILTEKGRVESDV